MFSFRSARAPLPLPLPLLLLLLLLSTLLQGTEANFKPSAEDVHCYNFDNACNICIREPLCQWCSESKDVNKTEHHCFSKKTDLTSFCHKAENPPNPVFFSILRDEAFTDGKAAKKRSKDIIQLKPQETTVKLRKGVPYNVTISFRQVEDYPLDLYYMMDLSKSMKEDKDTLASLGNDLAKTMQNLTSRFRIGFGSFIDKVMLPFVNIHPKNLEKPCPKIDCATPFSFENNLKLNSEAEKFVRQVKLSKLSSNLDTPEGGFDGLMQAMVCEEQIGWRKNVRKIIVFSTDAAFHMAGDGKLAGVVKPNDGECHMNSEGFYDKYDENDYPSLGQINAVAQEKGVNIIFAAKGHQELYSRLSKRIKDSSHGELSSNSRNVIELVARVYNSITDKVEFSERSKSQDTSTSVRIFTNCGNSSAPPEEISVCNDVSEGETFDVIVEVMVTDCSQKSKRRSEIKIGTLQNSATINVEFVCDCDCEDRNHKGYEEKSPSCSYRGTKQCEVCVCDSEMSYGEQCQCKKNEVALKTLNDQSKCRPEGSNSTVSVCSGRGRCECETCKCWKNRHSGKFCQCDSEMCRQYISSNEECSGNGKCGCNSCLCNPGWEGDFCECRSKQSCVPAGGGKPCSGNGKCVCGKCECDVSYTGKHCEDCQTCGQGKCLEFRACVQCDVWGSGELKGDACKNCSYGKIPTLTSLESPLNSYALLCTFEDEFTGCDFNFTYKYTEEGYEIFAQNQQECPKTIDIMAVTFGVVGGIVAIGVLTLIIWKILTTLHDRREFLLFQKNQKDPKWKTEINPLYREPITTVSNPAFNTK